MRRVCITQIHFIRNVKAVGSHLTATGTSLVQQIERQCVFYIYKFGAAAFSAVVMNRQRIITCCSKKICCKAGTRCTRNLWQQSQINDNSLTQHYLDECINKLRLAMYDADKKLLPQLQYMLGRSTTRYNGSSLNFSNAASFYALNTDSFSIYPANLSTGSANTIYVDYSYNYYVIPID